MLAYQEKFDERESWHKLVVKIISWKDGLANGGSIQLSDKISPKEWHTYCNRITKTNITQGTKKVADKLKETQKMIKSYGGFGK